MNKLNFKKIAFSDNFYLRFSVVRKVFYTFLYHKKLTLGIALIAVVLLPSMSAHAQISSTSTENTINIQAQFAEPTITEAGGYHHVSMYGASSIGNPGEPELPAAGINVLIPADKKIKSFEAILGKKTTLSNTQTVKVAPAQKPYPMGQSGGTTSPNYSTYNSSSPYPGGVIEGVSTQDMRGYKIATFIIHPVEYIPKEGTISYYESITIKITLADDNEPLSSFFRNSPEDRQRVESFVVNTQDIASYDTAAQEASPQQQSTPQRRTYTVQNIVEPVPGGYKYVIITSEALKNANVEDLDGDGIDDYGPNSSGKYSFQDLLWEKEGRVTATIVTTEWIYANYQGEDNAAKIRNFIRDAYVKWETDYILLGGDATGHPREGYEKDELPRDIIPVRFLYDRTGGDTPATGGYYETLIPSDLYYACLDGSMDADGSGVYGAPGDGADIGQYDIDLIAEVYIGRAPVVTAEDVHNFVRKNLIYRLGSPSVLTTYQVGEYLGFGGIAQDAKYALEEIRLGSADAYKVNAAIYDAAIAIFPAFYEYVKNLIENPTAGFDSLPLELNTLYDADWAGEGDCASGLCGGDGWPVKVLIDIINAGVHLINHLGHANVGYVMKMYNDLVDALTNYSDPAFIYSQGCLPGAFEQDSIAEHFLNSLGGAVAVIFNSRYGWGEYQSTGGPSQHFAREFWDAPFGEDIYQLGPANQDSKEDNYWNIDEPMHRWVYLETNLFGDPELALKFDVTNGAVRFKRHISQPDAQMEIFLVDSDLNNSDDVKVKVSGETETTPEEVTLTKEDLGSGMYAFKGSIQLKRLGDGETPAEKDGILSVSNEETITVTYHEKKVNEETGYGEYTVDKTDTAIVDGVPPVITKAPSTANPGTRIGGHGYVTIEWLANEPSLCKVYYGTSPLSLIAKTDFCMSKYQAVTLDSLSTGETYYYYVESTDLAGNVTVKYKDKDALEPEDGDVLEPEDECYTFILYPPEIEVEPLKLFIDNTMEGSTFPIIRRLTIKNTSTNPESFDLVFQIEVPCDPAESCSSCNECGSYGCEDCENWITFPKSWGTVRYCSAEEVDIIINPRELKRGVHKREIIISNNCGGEIRIPLEVTVVRAPAVHSKGYHIKDDWSGRSFLVNGDGRLNPGEEVELEIEAENFGSLAAYGVSAVLSVVKEEEIGWTKQELLKNKNGEVIGFWNLENPIKYYKETKEKYITILDDEAEWGDIPAGEAKIMPDSFLIKARKDTLIDLKVTFGLDITDRYGHLWHEEFEMKVEINKWAGEDVPENILVGNYNNMVFKLCPQVSSDNKGNVYLLWTENRNDNLLSREKLGMTRMAGTDDGNYNYEIYFNVSHDHGITWHENDIRLNTNEPGAADSFPWRPKMASDENGNVYVVWQDNRNDPDPDDSDTYGDIYFNVSHDHGETWLENDIRLDTDEPGAARSDEPQIACDNYGGVYVVWQDTRNGMMDIYFNYSHDYGSTWQEEDIRIEQGNGPRIACDDYGDVYVAYRDSRNSVDYEHKTGDNSYYIYQLGDIYLNYSRDFGCTWQAEGIRLDTDEPGVGDSLNPEISCDSNGNVYVAWTDARDGWVEEDGTLRGYEIYLNRSQDFGETWERNDLPLETGEGKKIGVGGDAWDHEVSCDERGNVYVTWRHSNIYFNRSQDFGETWFQDYGDTEIKLNNDNWEELVDNYEIIEKDQGNDTVEVTSKKGDPLALRPEDPEMASDNYGNIYVAWNGSYVGQDGTREDTSAMYFDYSQEYGDYFRGFSHLSNSESTWQDANILLTKSNELMESADPFAVIPVSHDISCDNNGNVYYVWTNAIIDLLNGCEEGGCGSNPLMYNEIRFNPLVIAPQPEFEPVNDYYKIKEGETLEFEIKVSNFKGEELVLFMSTSQVPEDLRTNLENAALITSYDEATGENIGKFSWTPGAGVGTMGVYELIFVAREDNDESHKSSFEYVTIAVTSQAEGAYFTASPTEGDDPLIVFFKDLSTGAITSWLWDFGDGETSTLANPSHVYNGPGSYAVSLTVSGSEINYTETKQDFITVLSAPPEADFTAFSRSGPAPHGVKFSDQSTGTVISWLWDFGDGAISKERHPVHVYNNSGTYDVSLTVSGPEGTDTKTKKNYIAVYIPPPSVDFTASPKKGIAPHTVSFLNMSTGAIDKIIWDLGDGATSEEENPIHIYGSPGIYKVTLTAMGPGGDVPEERDGYIMVISDKPATIYGNISCDKAVPKETLEELTVTLKPFSYEGGAHDYETKTDKDGNYRITDIIRYVKASDNPDITLLNYKVYVTSENYDDYTGSEILFDAINESVEYNIKLTAKPPIADFAFSPAEGETPLTVNFTDQSRGIVTKWEWDFGDSGRSEEKNPIHTYSNPDYEVRYYLIKLIVEGPGGKNTSEKYSYVKVHPAPVVQYKGYRIIDEMPGRDYMINDDGKLSAGEQVELEIEIENIGTFEAEGLIATLSLLEGDEYITIVDNEAKWQNLPVNTAELKEDSFIIRAREDTPYKHRVTFALDIRDYSGHSWYAEFEVEAAERSGAFIGGNRPASSDRIVDKWRVQTCSDEAGNIYVVWQDSRNDSEGGYWGNSDIYFNSSHDNGQTWLSEDIRLDTDGPGEAKSWDPRISCDNNGNVYVVWQDERNGQSDIYFNSSHDHGNTWLSEDIRLNKYGQGAAYPKIACDESGKVYVTWQDSWRSIYFDYSHDYGSSWQEEEMRLDTDIPVAGSSYYPEITCDNNGGIYVVWQDSRNGQNDIYFNCSHDSGLSWLSEDIRLDTDEPGAADSSSPKIACDDNGGVYATWIDDRRGGSDIYFNYSRDYGDTWQEEDIKIGTRLFASPEISSDNNGNVYVVGDNGNHSIVSERGNNPYDKDIYLASSHNAGADWQDDIKLDTDIEPESQLQGTDGSPTYVTYISPSPFPRISSDNHGNIYVTWIDKRRGDDDIYFNYSRDFGASWNEDILLTRDDPSERKISDHLLSSDSNGNVYVIWNGSIYNEGSAVYFIPVYVVQELEFSQYEDSYIIKEGESLEFEVKAKNPKGEPFELFLDIEGLPWNLKNNIETATFTTSYDETTGENIGTFSWTPAQGTVGEYHSLVIVVRDEKSKSSISKTITIKVNPPTKADFIASTREGAVPLQVNFTDTSTGIINRWEWNFGDGGTSTERSPSHIYRTPGIYTVTLAVEGDEGENIETKQDHIKVAPIADFTASPRTGKPPLTVSFTDKSIGAVDKWMWNFGDGKTSSERNPAYTYKTAGTYTVNLSVFSPSGWNTLTKKDYITISSTATPPMADFKAFPSSGTPPLRVSFTGTSTGAVNKWQWDFGDKEKSTAQNVEHIYRKAGLYTVSLAVEGPTGKNAETKKNYINVTDETPLIQYKGHRIIDDWSGTNRSYKVNGDVWFNPGERVELQVKLENSGVLPAKDIKATLSLAKEDKYITILDDEVELGNLPVGGVELKEDSFLIEARDDTPIGRIVKFSLDITDAAGYLWREEFEVEVKPSKWLSAFVDDYAPASSINSVYTSNNKARNINIRWTDHRNNNNETGQAELKLVIENSPPLPAQDISAKLSLVDADPYITILDDEVNMVTVAPAEQIQDDSFLLEVSGDAPIGHIFKFSLEIQDTDRWFWQRNFEIEVEKFAVKTIDIGEIKDARVLYSYPIFLESQASSSGISYSKCRVQTCSDENGNIYVVWLDNRNDPGPYDDENYFQYDVYFNSSHDNGKTWLSEDIKLNKDELSAEISYSPQISCDNEGNVYVVWVDKRNGKYDVYFNSSYDFGETWLEEDVRLDTDEPGATASWSPKICSDNSGRVYVVWSDGRNGQNNDIYLNYSHDYGETWLNEDIRLDTDIAGGDVSYPEIACDNDGRVYVVWTDGRNSEVNRDTYSTSSDGEVYTTYATYDIYLNYSHDGGKTWLSEDIRLDTDEAGAATSIYPKIACDESGGVYVAWEDDRNYSQDEQLSDIYFNYSRDSGYTWQENDIKLGAYARDPQLSCDNNGGVYVVWSKQDGIFFNSSRDYGAGWLGTEIQLDDMSILKAFARAELENAREYTLSQFSSQFSPMIDYWQGKLFDIRRELYQLHQQIQNDKSILQKIGQFESNELLACQWALDKIRAVRDGNEFTDEVNGICEVSIDFSTIAKDNIELEKESRIQKIGEIFSHALAEAGAFHETLPALRTKLAELISPNKMTQLIGDDGPQIENSYGDRPATSYPYSAYPQNPEISLDDYGNIYVTWIDKRRGDDDIYFNYSQDFGASWNGDILLTADDPSERNISEYSLSSDSNGNVYVAWDGSIYNEGNGVYFIPVYVAPELELGRIEDSYIIKEGETLGFEVKAKNYKGSQLEFFLDAQGLPEELKDNIETATFTTSYDENIGENIGTFGWTPDSGMAGEYYPVVIAAKDELGKCELQAILIYVIPSYYDINFSSPKADFKVSVSQGVAPLKVYFTNNSTGWITDYSWNLGHSFYTSTEKNPTFTYTYPGTFIISLTVSGPLGEDTVTKEITVLYPPPEADIGASQISASPYVVQFSDYSTGNITRREWDFGDGGTSAEENPVHTYANIGTYTVTLIVTGPGGEDTKRELVKVYPAIKADFATTPDPASGNPPFSVEFIDKSVGDIYAWEWDFGDGKKSTLRNPVHEYTMVKTNPYSVTLTVKGPLGTDVITKDCVVVSNKPPVAEFSVDETERSGKAPLQVHFTNQSTGTVDTDLWDFGDPASGNANTSTDKSPAHTYNNPGEYTVKLTVTGPEGTSTEVKQKYIKVYDAEAPVAAFSASKTSGLAPLEVQFTNQSTQPTGTINTYLWNFGDGKISDEKNPTHIYVFPNTFTVSLTVTGSGGSNTLTKQYYINALPEAPVAVFSASKTNVVIGDEVQFTDYSTGTITQWFWIFGDGAISPEENPVHIYNEAGTYSVSLRVKGAGGEDEKWKYDYIKVYSSAADIPDDSTDDSDDDSDEETPVDPGPEDNPDELITLNIDIIGAGTVQREPMKQVYYYKEQVTLEAIPSAGNHFVKWEGISEGANNSRITITMDSSKSIIANFDINKYTLKVNNGSGSGVYEHGKEVTIEADIIGGRDFVKWSGNTKEIADIRSSSTTITMLGDAEVTAEYLPTATFLVIYQAENGTTDPEPGVYAGPRGRTVTISAIPDEGYQFDYWRVGNDFTESEDSITITMDSDKSITAEFSIISEQSHTPFVVDNYNDGDQDRNNLGNWTGGGGGGLVSLQEISLRSYAGGKESGVKEITYDCSKDGGYAWYASNLWDNVAYLDVSDYRYLTFCVKGENGGEEFYIALQYGDPLTPDGEPETEKEYGHSAKFVTVTTEWQYVIIPLDTLHGLDKAKMRTIVIEFDHELSLKQGTIYIDNLQFLNGYGKPESTGSVRIDQETGELFVDGERFVIMVIDYSNQIYESDIHREVFAGFKQEGCNTIYIGSLPWNPSYLSIMESANSCGLKVIAGFWMNPDLDYDDPSVRNSVKQQFTDFINAYKDSPAILAWALGNQGGDYYDGFDDAYYYLCNELAKIAYEIEGSLYHPVIFVNGDYHNLLSIDTRIIELHLNYIDAWKYNDYYKSFGDINWQLEEGDDASIYYPIVSDIPAQIIVDGQDFASINLDGHLEKADNDILWHAEPAVNLTVYIDQDNVASVTYPNGWRGSETVTFIATDEYGENDSETVKFTVAKDSKEIQARINAAYLGEVIEIEPAAYVFTSDLVISKDITLKTVGPGNMTFILGDYSIIIKEAVGDEKIENVTIEGITITAHTGKAENGPIQNYAKNLTLKNCRIIENKGITASAVYTAYMSNLNLENTVILKNINIAMDESRMLSAGRYWNSKKYCGTIYLGGRAGLNVNKSTIAYNANENESDEIKYGAIQSSWLNNVNIADSIMLKNGTGNKYNNFSSMIKWRQRQAVTTSIINE